MESQIPNVISSQEIPSSENSLLQTLKIEMLKWTEDDWSYTASRAGCIVSALPWPPCPLVCGRLTMVVHLVAVAPGPAVQVLLAELRILSLAKVTVHDLKRLELSDMSFVNSFNSFDLGMNILCFCPTISTALGWSTFWLRDHRGCGLGSRLLQHFKKVAQEAHLEAWHDSPTDVLSYLRVQSICVFNLFAKLKHFLSSYINAAETRCPLKPTMVRWNFLMRPACIFLKQRCWIYILASLFTFNAVFECNQMRVQPDCFTKRFMLAEYRRSFDTFSMATSAHCCIAVTLPNVAQWQDAEDSDLWLGQDKRCSFKPAALVFGKDASCISLTWTAMSLIVTERIVTAKNSWIGSLWLFKSAPAKKLWIFGLRNRPSHIASSPSQYLLACAGR